MERIGKQLWWIYMLNGIAALLIAAILVGATAFSPVQAVAVLFWAFGIYLVAKGGVTVAAAVWQRRDPIWLPLMLNGLLSLVLGALMIFSTGITVLAFMFVLSLWLILVGVFDIASAIKVRKRFKSEWTLALSGLVAVMAGTLILLFPTVGMLGVLLLFTGYCAVSGIVGVVLGVRMRRGSATYMEVSDRAYDERGSEVHSA